jgi:hypothetical protein
MIVRQAELEDPDACWAAPPQGTLRQARHEGGSLVLTTRTTSAATTLWSMDSMTTKDGASRFGVGLG